jgi:predicted MFS family arabinose efflux permease
LKKNAQPEVAAPQKQGAPPGPELQFDKMLTDNANGFSTSIGVVVLVLGYGVSLWQIFSRYPGDKFIRSALITVMAFVLVMAATKVPFLPDWATFFLQLLLGVLTLLSVFFGLQQACGALRRHNGRKNS